MKPVRESLEDHLGSHQVAHVVYGTILGLALVVVLGQHPPRASVVIVWILATAVAVALAELFSEVVDVETSERRRVTRHQLVGMLDAAAAVAVGVAFPAVYFVFAAIGLVELDTAFTIATWSGVGLIGLYGYMASRLAGLSVAASLVRAALVALIGAALVTLKVVVH